MTSENRLPNRRLAAIVCTDIVDYSATVHRDEVLGERLLNRQRAVVRRLLPRFGGREVKTSGDNFLLEFDSALAAVQAVIAIQRALVVENAKTPSDPPVVLRAAIHLGDVEHRGRDVFGDGVNTAAHLLPLSPEGGIAVSAAVLDLVRQRLVLPARSLGAPSLKNITHPVEVFVVNARDLHGTDIGEATGGPSSLTARLRQKPWLAAAAMLAVAAALYIAYGLSSLSRTPISNPVAATPDAEPQSLAERTGIAVLPLVNQSGDPGSEYFSDGLTEELISALAQLRGLRVIGRSSSFRFKGKSQDARSIGRELHVGTLLEGSVRRQGERVRISARLINAADGSPLWSETYDRELKDIFAVQSEIAEAVAAVLMIAPQDRAGMALNPSSTQNLDAYNALLLGNFYYERSDRESWRMAIGRYEEAVRLDPGYAPAHAKLGITWGRLASTYLSGNAGVAAYAEARTAAMRALSLAPNLADAHAALGWVLLNAELNVPAAEVEMSMAAEQAPTDAATKTRLAYVEACLGRTERAVALAHEAIALDPLSSRGYLYLSQFMTTLRRYDEADAAIRRALELQPSAASQHKQLAVIELKRRNTDGALRAARLEADPSWRDYALTLARQTLGDRKVAAAALGNFIARNAGTGAFKIASIHALRGDPDAVFEWLDKAYAVRDPAVTSLLQDPFLIAFKSDPRFGDFCRKVGLPEI